MSGVAYPLVTVRFAVRLDLDHAIGIDAALLYHGRIHLVAIDYTFAVVIHSRNQ